MALPTDANVDLLICDSAQHEPSGKINLTGLYPTPEIKIDPNAQLPAHLNLAFVFVLKDGDGDFPISVRIVDPLGKELFSQALPNIKKVVGQGYAVSLNLQAIPILKFGSYAVELGVGDQSFRRTMRVFQ
jgi:hypothetical protein